MLNTYDFKIAHPGDFAQLAVKDVLFVYYRCPQVDRMVQLYTHYNEIAFTLSGKKTLYQSDRAWTLTENRALFLRKTAYTQEMYDEGWEVLAFYFKDEFIKQVYTEFRQHSSGNSVTGMPSDMLIELNVSDITRGFFYSMIPYFSQRNCDEHLLEMKFRELLLTIFSDPLNDLFRAYASAVSDRVKTTIWEVMEANYMYNLPLADYARMTDRSIASFTRDFQAHYGTTPGKWLTTRRLEHANRLLQNSDKPVSEIAFESGFENAAHFSRVYKNKYGASPANHRKDSRRK